ncbi:MAG: DNA-binding protein [Thaumarchaeota archaeon]|nr:DNA-binding protein [Nitrososphaerota archaeon]
METTSGADNQPQRNEEVEKQRLIREQMLRVLLTSDARDRLNNVRIVKPEIAKSIESQLMQLASTGRVKRPINDDELKELLSSFQQPKRDFKIKWV